MDVACSVAFTTEYLANSTSSNYKLSYNNKGLVIVSYFLRPSRYYLYTQRYYKSKYNFISNNSWLYYRNKGTNTIGRSYILNKIKKIIK